MSDLFVILKESLIGSDINLSAGDKYFVQSQEQGDMMVSRDMAAWPELETVKPTSKKKEEPVAQKVEPVADVAVSNATNADSDALQA